MCECYKIGGRFIAEDPDCPVHGYEAQREQRRMEMSRQNSEQVIEEMAGQILSLQEEVRSLRHIVENFLKSKSKS